MSKNILVISSTLRAGGNSDCLAEEFVKGALQNGNNVEKISLRGKKIGFCRGCLSCQSTGKCVIKDDANEIVEKMKNADILVLCTPVYYYGMSGQLKTLLDRANPLYDSDYKFRDIYFLLAAADTDEENLRPAVISLNGWISCFPKAGLRSVVYGTGATDAGEIKGSPAMQKAFVLGLNA